MFAVALTVTNDGGIGEDVAAVSVANAPPTVTVEPIGTALEGDVITFTGGFIDTTPPDGRGQWTYQHRFFGIRPGGRGPGDLGTRRGDPVVVGKRRG